MQYKRLHRPARLVIAMSTLYTGAIGLSSIFVSVYLWVNSHDFVTVCLHHLTMFAVTPVAFIFSGWYARTRDRLHVYRAGLVLHLVFYCSLLILRERSPQYAVHLGALLGVTWGMYWAGANTLSYDVTNLGEREHFLGLMAAVAGLVNLFMPVVGGAIIRFAGNTRRGYHVVFWLVVLMFLLCIALSFLLPAERKRRPYRILRALLPGRDQRDWRLMMGASLSMSGNWHIFPFLLGMLMFMHTDNELAVGAYGSFQGLAGVVTAVAVGRLALPRNRRTFLFAATWIHVVAGILILMPVDLTAFVLCLFALLRSTGALMFGIPHGGLNMDIISKIVADPSDRIEYICAWETPLGVGRVLVMLATIGLYYFTSGSEYTFRIMLFLMCMFRVATYQFDIRTSLMRTRPPEPARPLEAVE